MTDPQHDLDLRIDTGPWSLDALHSRVAESPGALFAILDPADDPRVLAKARELEGDRAESLFDGYAAAKYVAIAPWLVELDAERLAWLLETPAGTPWGVVVESTAEARVLRRQLQSALMARFPDGTSAFFRFYDPRILRSFLSSATPSELTAFYGEHVRAFMTIDGGAVTRWALWTPR